MQNKGLVLRFHGIIAQQKGYYFQLKIIRQYYFLHSDFQAPIILIDKTLLVILDI